jgi:predicted enzyme related to lactoylglutathione lyase
MAGKLVHFEVVAADLERAKRFYEALFNWGFKDAEMPMPYALIDTKGGVEGGAFASEDRDGHLVCYFDAEDIDASVVTVRTLGGEAEEKHPIPGIGWFARCKDSEGNAFSLFQADESVTVPDM